VCRTGGAVAPDVVSYNLVTSLLAQTGRGEEALRILSCLHEAGLQPNISTYSGLMGASAERGEYSIVLGAWRDLQTSQLRPGIACVMHFVEAVAKMGLAGGLIRL
jgi:pentatricopeptide repeat protein